MNVLAHLWDYAAACLRIIFFRPAQARRGDTGEDAGSLLIKNLDDQDDFALRHAISRQPSRD